VSWDQLLSLVRRMALQTPKPELPIHLASAIDEFDFWPPP
jgi:hypothetical protein